MGEFLLVDGDGQIRTVVCAEATLTLPAEACPVVQAAWDRVEPGEMLCDDPWVRPGTMEARRWTLAGGRAVWPCP